MRIYPFYFYGLLFLAVIFLLAGGVNPARAAASAPPPSCAAPGTWASPKTGKPLDTPSLIGRMAAKAVVLLGETHDNSDHHRWQLQVLAALHGRNPNMVLAFESFPRSVQPALDRWTRGELTEKQFLDQSRWFDVWRYDPALYLSLFHFARINRIPMVAMNVDQTLIKKISAGGWQAVAVEARQGIGDPAPPSEAYRNYLAEVYGSHGKPEKETTPGGVSDDPAFHRFVEAQTVWDRAMAEKLAEVRNAGGKPLVVGIAGWGHLQYGYGIPRQLRQLGIQNPAVLLPWDEGTSCQHTKDAAGTPVADAIFGLPQSIDVAAHRPRLGIMIVTEDGQGVRVTAVVAGSIAETTGIEKDDLIVAAAGKKTPNSAELIRVVQAQQPGTWLPLTLIRNGTRLERIAKFPAR